MKTKSLIISMALVACSFFTASAQELLISENFSSQAWADELARLNPGTSANANALNPVAYATPLTAAPNTYLSLNAVDRYFGKYLLLGDIECLPVLPCASGDQITHDFNNGGTPTAVAFRIDKAASTKVGLEGSFGFIEFPQIASAGTISLHIRDGHSSNPSTIGLEKYDAATSVWVPIYTIPLANFNAYPTTRDEVVTYNINSSEPITLRVINNIALGTKRYANLYGVDITAYSASGVQTVKVIPFKLIGRKLISEQPTNLSLYNAQGALVFEKSFVTEIELPASLGTGLFLAKNGQGTQKIFIK